MVQTITSYFVVTSRDRAELERKVERQITVGGWKLQGGVAYWDGNWAQAMTKEAPKIAINYPVESPAYQELYA